jgi:N-acyl-L-homoserine lactone synthetase
MSLIEIEPNSNIAYDQSSTLLENGLWAGYVAMCGGIVMDEKLLARAHVLRGNVYVDELAWLEDDHLDNQGQEYDRYDNDSDHLVMSDTNIFGVENPFVFANLRYIHRDQDKPLPVEDEFGLRLMTGKDAIEMSRFMSRHFDAKIESLASVFLVSHTIGMLAKTAVEGYAVLEIPLLRRLKGMGVVLEQLSEIKTLEGYGNTRNCAVRIAGSESIERAKELAGKKENFPYARLFEIAKSSNSLELLTATCEELLTTKSEVPV